MIRVVAKFYVKENSINEFTKLFEGVVPQARKEKGCISYELFGDANDKSIITVLEEWDSMSDLDVHMNTPEFKGVIPVLTEYSKKDFEINIYNKLL